MSKKQAPAAKRILIYGDSNVWGANFASKRIHYSDRWVNRLDRTLRGRAQVTADGVRGRVAGDFRTDKPHKNGLSTFTTALQKADNFDLIIIALGTNDLQQRFARTPEEIVRDLLEYRNLAGKTPIIYILPPCFDTSDNSGYEFTDASEQLRQKLLQRKKELGNYIELPKLPLSDGLHFSPLGHYQVFKIVREVLKSYI